MGQKFKEWKLKKLKRSAHAQVARDKNFRKRALCVYDVTVIGVCSQTFHWLGIRRRFFQRIFPFIMSWRQRLLSLCGCFVVLAQVRKRFLSCEQVYLRWLNEEFFVLKSPHLVQHLNWRKDPFLIHYNCLWFCVLVSPLFEKAARIDKARSDHVKRTALGKETTLKCVYTGNPPPEVHWTKNGKRLGDKCTFCVQKVENLNGVSALRVTPFRDSDFGEYKCKARNKLGFGHIKIKLQEDKTKSKFYVAWCCLRRRSGLRLAPRTFVRGLVRVCPSVFWGGRGEALNRVLHGEAPLRGPYPYPFI